MKQHKKSFFLIVAVVVILIAGFFTYSQYHDKKTQQDNVVKKSTKKSPDTPKPAEQKQDEKQNDVVKAKKSTIPQLDPQKGEILVEGTVKSVDAEKRIITINNQLMDDNSKPVNPNVPVGKDAIIQDKNSDIAITQIKNGDHVSIMITREGQARAVLVNY